MQAEILDLSIRFEVQPEAWPDGNMGPPARMTLTLRPCWRKPPVKLELEFAFTNGEIAYYHVLV